jgi:Protein of unknown function (DUF3375)
MRGFTNSPWTGEGEFMCCSQSLNRELYNFRATHPLCETSRTNFSATHTGRPTTLSTASARYLTIGGRPTPWITCHRRYQTHALLGHPIGSRVRWHDTFVRPNIRTLAQADLASRLDDYPYALRRELGQDAFPREAASYLENWASDQHAWLRKYYHFCGGMPASLMTRLHISASALRNTPTFSGASGRLS